MFELKRVMGAALALGASACAEAHPTKAERDHVVYTELQAEQARLFAVWDNCGIRAHEGKRPGTLEYIYAQENECQEEYRAFDQAFMRRQHWEETHEDR